MEVRFPVFVLSLNPPEHERNAQLAAQLGAHGFKATFIPGVKGREIPAGEYFDLIQNYARLRGLTMTPSEVGCALGHLAVYRSIIRCGAEAAVVLEDDVLLDDLAMQRIAGLLTAGMHRKGFLSLGGQDGLEHLFGTVHGKLVDEKHEIWRILLDDLPRVHRTVGYVISSSLAHSLVRLASEGLYVIDDYSFICSRVGIEEFYVSNCVGHPADLSNSSIESERLIARASLTFTGASLPSRLRAEVMETIVARREMRAYKKRVVGWRRVNWASRFKGST